MKVEERVEQEALFEPPLETPKVKAERLPLSSFNTETELPEGWEWIRLGTLLEQQERKVRLEPDKTYTRLGVRWYAEGPFVKEAVLGRDIKGKDLYSVEAGEFIFSRLFAWKGSFGFVTDLEHGAFVSNEFPTFKPNTELLDSEFLWRMFSQAHIWRFIEERSEGSTQTSRLRFKEADLLRLEIPLPPLSEQKAIAAALRAVRDSREATARALEEAKAFKRSLMRHVFTFGPVSLEEAGNVELQETAIGSIPKVWEVKTLESIAKIGNGSTPKRDTATYWDGGSFPWMTSGKVHEGRISYADQFVTETALKECHLPMVPAGSVLIAITGQGKTLGTAAITEIDTTVNQHIAYAKFENAKEWNEFVYHYLKFKYEDLRAVALTCGFLKTYKIPAPDLEQREQINESFNAADTFYESLESRLSSLDALFQSLLYHLMTGRVRVPASTTGDA
jgi:type I restriction enzyme, S subunit